MSGIRCIFGCEDAVVLAYAPQGCVCHPDQWQWLCAQHFQSAEPIGSMHAAPDGFLAPVAELRERIAALEVERDAYLEGRTIARADNVRLESQLAASLVDAGRYRSTRAHVLAELSELGASVTSDALDREVDADLARWGAAP